MRYFLAFILTTLLLLSGCSEPINRDTNVGRLHRAYVDTARTNWANDGPRPLSATVWGEFLDTHPFSKRAKPQCLPSAMLGKLPQRSGQALKRVRNDACPDSTGTLPSHASFFRNWKNIFGLPEVEGIDALSDQRINEIYSEVRDAFCAIAKRKKESLPDSTINGLVRVLLMDDVNGNFPAQLSQGTAMYNEHPIQIIFWKGRAY